MGPRMAFIDIVCFLRNYISTCQIFDTVEIEILTQDTITCVRIGRVGRVTGPFQIKVVDFVEIEAKNSTEHGIRGCYISPCI